MDPTTYMSGHAHNILMLSIDKYDLPKTEAAKLACKEITSELSQMHKALELGINYNRFCDLLQEKALAVQKIKDLRGDGIPDELLRHADKCIDLLNESKRDWKKQIDATYDDSKEFHAYYRQRNWLESEIEFLYCKAIVQEDPTMSERSFLQEAFIIQHEQAAARKRIEFISDSIPLLRPMTQGSFASPGRSRLASTGVFILVQLLVCQ